MLLNGDRITQTHNNNYSNFDDKAVNAKIDDAQEGADADELGQRRSGRTSTSRSMQQAAWAPFVNRQFTDFFSEDMDLCCYVNHVLYQFDFARSAEVVGRKVR